MISRQTITISFDKSPIESVPDLAPISFFPFRHLQDICRSAYVWLRCKEAAVGKLRHTKNVWLHGRLDAFADALHHAPENIDVFWTNTFTLKVNNWLNVLYSIDVASDDDIKKFGYFHESSAFQFKSILGVGVSGKVGGKNKMMRNKKGM